MAKGKAAAGKTQWQDTRAATEEQTRLADEFAMYMAPFVRDAQRDGAVLKNQIAKWLNENGHKTRLGKPWSRVAVKRLFVRLKKLHDAGWRSKS